MKDRRILILASLLLLLLTSCGVSPAEGGEAESPSPPPSTTTPADTTELPQEDTPAYYAAYADIVREYHQQYGPERIQQISTPVDEMNYLMGVCVVRLIDFDLDGTLELLLSWPESEEAYHSYVYAIWTSPDGQTAVKVCENKIFDGIQAYGPSIRLIGLVDGTYLGEDYEVTDADEAHIYRKITASGVSDALTLAYIPPFGQDEQYLVNGEPVNADAYAQAESDFLNGAQTEQIDFVLPAFGDTTQFAGTIQATQDTLLLLGIEPNETALTVTGDNTAGTERVNYAPYTELIDEYLLEYGQPQILPSSRLDGKDDIPALGGLCVVRTVDLDGDGTNELILAYAQKAAFEGKHISYGYDIWALRDGAAQELIRASIPGTAYEPCMTLCAGQTNSYMTLSYDTNTDQVTSIANLEYEVRCYGYDGKKLSRSESLADLPDEVRNNETDRIYFTANSYRWSAGMDWDEDSQQVLNKTLETINLVVGTSY